MTEHFRANEIPPFLKALTQFCEEAGKYIERHGGEPAANSQAATELATYVEPHAIRAAWGLSNLLIEFAADHVFAFVKLATEPMDIEASWTCVRSMLESCSIGAWVTDPTIGARERAGRTYAHRYEGMTQQLKVAEGEQVDEINTQLDAIERQAIAAGFAPMLNKNNKRCGIAHAMPGATALIETVLGEEKTYRLLSAIAHGHNWAVFRIAYEVVGEPQNSELLHLKKKASPDQIVFLRWKAFKSLTRLLWNHARFCGWHELELEEPIDTVADRIHYPTKDRFWRSK